MPGDIAEPSSSPTEKEIFFEALERTTVEARAAYLDGACRHDPALRRRVDALLANHFSDESFMSGPAAAGKAPGSSENASSGTPAPPTEQPGQQIGRYKLLEKLGDGGFGVVYMAEQREPVKRRVALKIIKVGMDIKEVIARFEAERQALALMDHPNIAKVLDGGATDTGRPYFVMELVRGIRITDFCDQNRLGLKERLELFMQVCHAVQHAHQKGIIHRDLKPSNILVTINDGVPVPKVIDFGIAKATQQELTEKTLFTAYGQFMGTPAYMSPEQAVMTSLDIDTRSDIYSLGVLLYELITGKQPFDTHALLKVGLDELCRTLREVEPPRPSTRLKQDQLARLRGQAKSEIRNPKSEIDQDLDWIVMKCLEKDRRRRYEAANGLAADIQRHLNNEPISARPPSMSYKFGKFARRNKAALAVAAGTAAVLVMATGVSLWQARVARKAQQDADAKAKSESAAREEAEVVADFLKNIFASADPNRGGRTVTVVATLDAATRKLETDLKYHPARRAQLQSTLGRTYRALGLHREAIPLMEKSRENYEATFGSTHRNTLLGMHALAQCYHAAGRRQEALRLQEETVARYRSVLGPKHEDTLNAVADLANYYSDASRLEEAIKLGTEVLELMRQVKGPEHPHTLVALGNLALAQFRAGRQEEALKLREEALTLDRKVYGPEHGHTLIAMMNLSESYGQAGRLDEATKLAVEAVDHMRRVNGPEHPGTLVALHSLADYYFRSRRWEEALKLREEVLVLMRKVNGPEHPNTLAAMNNLALSYSEAGREAEALQLGAEALERMRKANGPEHRSTLRAMKNMANLYRDAGRLEQELKLRQELLANARKSAANNPAEVESCLAALADAHYRGKDYASAEPLYREVLQSRSGRPGAEDSSTVRSTTVYLGRLLSDWAWDGRGTNASAAATRAHEGEEILRAALSGYQRRTNTPAWRLAEVQCQLGGAIVVTAVTDPALTPAARGPKLAEAEALLQQGRAGMEQDSQSRGRNRRDALEQFVRLYESWNELAPNSGQAAKAAEWKQKLADFDGAAANTKAAGAEP